MSKKVRCWWCSKECDSASALCAPKAKNKKKEWCCVGFFCSIACTKAYMLENKMKMSFLKEYLKKQYNVQYSTPLPSAVHWKSMDEFGGNIPLPEASPIPPSNNVNICRRVRETFRNHSPIKRKPPDKTITLLRRNGKERQKASILSYLKT